MGHEMTVTKMPLTRLRGSLFPNVAPYLTFIGPNESYDEDTELPEDLVINFTVAPFSSKTVHECIQRLGARVIEVDTNPQI